MGDLLEALHKIKLFGTYLYNALGQSSLYETARQEAFTAHVKVNNVWAIQAKAEAGEGGGGTPLFGQYRQRQWNTIQSTRKRPLADVTSGDEEMCNEENKSH